MWLQTWIIVASVFATGTRAAEITTLPTKPVMALRGRVHAILRGDRTQSPLKYQSTSELGRARVGLIALEEATKALVGPADQFTADRITRVLRFAERTLWDVDLSPTEFASMDGYLTVILNILKNPRPAAVVRMLYHHRAWAPHHLDYLVDQAAHWPGRPHTYRALRALRAHLSEDQLRTLRQHVRHADRELDALAMLEEFGGLASRRYVHLVHRLARDLASGRPNDLRYRARATEIKLRALDRIQRRWQRGDPLVRRAVRAAESLGGPARVLELFARLRTGRIEIDLSDQNLSSSDPLKLDPRSAANVVDFAACARRLGR